MRTRAHGLFALAILALLLPVAARQEPQHTSSAQAAHHAVLDQEREALEQGQGFGMALVADRNGYPGPKHILELQQELELTPAQVQQVRSLFESMHTRAVTAGHDVLAKEAKLEKIFASGTPDEPSVRRLLADVAAVRAELRWIHLSAHLEARAVLTPAQRARYLALRYGSHSH